MNFTPRKRIVVLGMMTKTPVAGVVWQTLHYLLGFERLGYEAYYVEAHARTPSMLMQRETDDGAALAAGFISSVMRRFGLAHRWAFHALHDDGGVYGMTEGELARLYGSAAVIVNLHGGTEPLPEHAKTGRLVYVETDPVQLQVELEHGLQQTIDFLEPHVAFFTFAENYGKEPCPLPVFDRFPFRPTRQPVVNDLWLGAAGAGEAFTTIGNWRQQWRDVQFRGERFTWSKDLEFAKFLDLPGRVDEQFELALASHGPPDRTLLESKGWRVRDALELSTDLDGYRRYIAGSRGEFTVAKGQNVRLCTGWFSDRSATYLAAGRPVVTQETGFSDNLTTGEGLFAVSELDEAVEAIGQIRADYERHRQAAFAIAREYFDAGSVLSKLLEEVGERSTSGPGSREAAAPFSLDLDLTVVSRRPTTLTAETLTSVVRGKAAGSPDGDGGPPPHVSIVVVTRDGLVFTRLCLESVLANTQDDFELIVVDNASTDGTAHYLAALSAHDSRVRVLLNDENRGFSRGVNQGLEVAQGDVLVLLNADTLVPPGWLQPLLAPLADAEVGLVGPTTNEAGNEAEVDFDYRTYGELVRFADDHARVHGETRFDIDMATMFCVALRRDVLQAIGPLDERFELGFFEDDDYSMRVREAGFRVVCAEGAYVHHFGEGSFGALVRSGERGRVFRENQHRFEEKWGIPWKPHERRPVQHYRHLAWRVREAVRTELPPGAVVLVASRGDETLVDFDGRVGWHFPQLADGTYAGHYPGTSEEAIAHLEALRRKGAQYLLLPETASWWLEFYAEFAEYLSANFERLDTNGPCHLFGLERSPAAVRRRGARPASARTVCVVGMHRSGTSMVAAALAGAGVDLGDDADMVPPSPHNPRGFWEHRQFVELNDRLLGELGGSWDLPVVLPEASAQDPRLEPIRREAEALLASFAGRRLWGWKDPRNSLTLPFWRQLVRGDLEVVVCVRHPVEIAGSLAHRNGHTQTLAFQLWLHYNRAIVERTTRADRVVTHFASYFPDPRPEIRRLLQALGMEVSEDVVARCAAAIAADLRHHQVPALQTGQLPAEVAELYRVLSIEAGVVDLVTVDGQPETGLLGVGAAVGGAVE